jgi:hypothetical protein
VPRSPVSKKKLNGQGLFCYEMTISYRTRTRTRTRGGKNLGYVGGLVAGKVGEVDPHPAGDQHILALDVAVANASRVGLAQRAQQLERDPLFLDVREERPRSKHTNTNTKAM